MRIALTVSRLTDREGASLLARRRTGDRRASDVHFVRASNGPPAGDLRARELGVADQDHLLGHRDDIPKLLAAADLSVLPSLFGGMPLAVLEAMAAGLPEVGMRVCGTPRWSRTG